MLPPLQFSAGTTTRKTEGKRREPAHIPAEARRSRHAKRSKKNLWRTAPQVELTDGSVQSGRLAADFIEIRLFNDTNSAITVPADNRLRKGYLYQVDTANQMKVWHMVKVDATVKSGI